MIKPKGSYYLVKQLETEDVTASGIFLPENKSERGNLVRGEILELGEGYKVFDSTLDNTFKVGDKVLFLKYAGQAFDYEHVKYQIVKEHDILAKYE